MIIAIDTDFVVAVEILDHLFHKSADALLGRLLEEGHKLAVAPQMLAEFVHVVTDSKRLKEPLSMEEALSGDHLDRMVARSSPRAQAAP